MQDLVPWSCHALSWQVSVVAPVAMQCPEPKRFARTGKNEESKGSSLPHLLRQCVCTSEEDVGPCVCPEELELLVYEAKTGNLAFLT